MPVTLTHIAAALTRAEMTLQRSESTLSDTDSNATAILAPPLSISERIIHAYHQRTIDKISNILSNKLQSETEKVAAFQALLTENWGFIKGTLLTYTALPDHPATSLWIKISKYVSAHTEEPIITCLMPTVSTDSLSDDYPDLTQHLSIRTLLRTHVLSDKSEYAIPVTQLKQYDLGNGPIGRLLNPYFDFSVHPGEYAQLSTDEMARLKSHSAETEALFNLIDEYHRLLNSEDNLLAKLQELLRLMTANSVNGIGQEMIAGRGGMIAVLNFFTYYHALSPENLAAVPDSVRNQLDILLKHSTPQPVLDIRGQPVLDPEGRPKIKLLNTDINACLALRSKLLKIAIKDNETALHQIGLSESTKSAKCEELASGIRNALENIASTHYRGHERLGFTTHILATLNIPFSFVDAELDLFNFIPPNEVALFFKQNQLALEFIRKFNTIDELAYVLLIWNPQTIEAVFRTIGDRIGMALSLFNANRDHFFYLISSLDLEKTEAIFQGLKSIMHRLVRCSGTPKDFFILPAEHCKLYFKHTHDHWARELNSLSFIVEFFNLQQMHLTHCRMAMTELGDIIEAQLVSLDSLHFLVSKFTASLFALFCEAYLMRITRFATDTQSFFNTYSIIPDQHKVQFIAIISPQLLAIIPTQEQLKQLIEHLNPTHVQIFFRNMTPDQHNHYFASTAEKKAFCSAIENEEKRRFVHQTLFHNTERQLGVRRIRPDIFQSRRRQPPAAEATDSDEETYVTRFSRGRR